MCKPVLQKSVKDETSDINPWGFCQEKLFCLGKSVIQKALTCTDFAKLGLFILFRLLNCGLYYICCASPYFLSHTKGLQSHIGKSVYFSFSA